MKLKGTVTIRLPYNGDPNIPVEKILAGFKTYLENVMADIYDDLAFSVKVEVDNGFEILDEFDEFDPERDYLPLVSAEGGFNTKSYIVTHAIPSSEWGEFLRDRLQEEEDE